MSKKYSKFDLQMTQRALELASFGLGQVSPSPLVGCVIVSKAGEIVGEGSYIFKEITHAEVIALKQAGDKAKGGTAYVSLEPHSHMGRTPPCTEALINAGIRRVVCPIEDPNPLVSGKGFEVLREHGIEVVTGILKEKAEKQNERFIHWHETKKPFVHLKMAISLDGKIATRTGDSKWITGKESREQVQNLRHQNDAILVGAKTVLADDPSLTDRSGKTRNRELIRVVLDNSLRIPLDSKLVLTAKEIPVIVFSDSQNKEKIRKLLSKGVEVVSTKNGGRTLTGILEELGERDIQGLLVEGGAEIAGAFFDNNLIDKVSFFIAPKIIGGRKAICSIGGKGSEFLVSVKKLKDIAISKHGDDLEFTGYC